MKNRPFITLENMLERYQQRPFKAKPFYKRLAWLIFYPNENIVQREAYTRTADGKRFRRVYKIKHCRIHNNLTKEGRSYTRYKTKNGIKIRTKNKQIINFKKAYKEAENIEYENRKLPFVQTEHKGDHFNLSKIKGYYPCIFYQSEWRPIFCNEIINWKKGDLLQDIQFSVYLNRKKRKNWLLSDLVDSYNGGWLLNESEAAKPKRVRIPTAKPIILQKQGRNLNDLDPKRVLGRLKSKLSVLNKEGL